MQRMVQERAEEQTDQDARVVAVEQMLQLLQLLQSLLQYFLLKNRNAPFLNEAVPGLKQPQLGERYVGTADSQRQNCHSHCCCSSCWIYVCSVMMRTESVAEEVEGVHSFWQTVMRSRQMHYSLTLEGNQDQAQTGGCQRPHSVAAAAVEAADGAEVELVVGAAVVFPAPVL